MSGESKRTMDRLERTGISIPRHERGSKHSLLIMFCARSGILESDSQYLIEDVGKMLCRAKSVETEANRNPVIPFPDNPIYFVLPDFVCRRHACRMARAFHFSVRFPALQHVSLPRDEVKLAPSDAGAMLWSPNLDSPILFPL